ncbi:aldehyde ferredoxin oxidoreductase [Neofamilia massiliensis]|uniref:aldehyde ferredoxin oxidoreductase n=1 Tax=Neofamilia massiliensis TaxID=1673724 RepID=UPI0006BB93A4|nr:aldehyde ferredoxin oxidoreductase [Neofamilia massiliensis]
MTLGFTGKQLRINLTTGESTVEDSLKYKDYIGGAGVGTRIMYEEVPVGTKPYDEANKLIYSVGPNTGTSAPCSGRITITSLSTFTKGHNIIHAHMGGEMAYMMKMAGYDTIIVEGKADKPVFIKIRDDEVSIEDASDLWGQSTRETTKRIADKIGKEYNTTAIGVAGENLVNLSCMLNATAHSGGGGTGAVMGSKNLKAISIYGTGGVKVADGKKILELNNYVMKDLMGSNNNHVVPSTERPWAEYHDPNSRWTGRPGLTWGAADGGPVDTGDAPPGELNKFGYRCQKAYKDFGPVSEKYTVKMGGCTSCPVRCYGVVEVPFMEEEGYLPVGANTCMPNFEYAKILNKPKDYMEEGDGTFLANYAALTTADELGLWENYGELPNTIKYFIDHNILEQILPKEEYDDLRWDLYEAGDPGFIRDIQTRIAEKRGEIAHLGEGAYFVNERYKDILGDDYLNAKEVSVISPLGWSKHHGNECAAQVGALTNIFYNRDCMTHTIVNIWGSGLPYDVLNPIIEGYFGKGCLDKVKNYTPMNESKAKFAKFGVVRQWLHDSFTLCNWVWPMTLSPLPERGYKGDLTVEAQYMTAITGDEWSMEDLDFAAERGLQLLRATTVLGLNTVDMRNEHDAFNDWVYDMDPDFKAFEEGTIKMDRADMQTALTMIYREMGWDEVTGAPTRATLEKFGLGDVADDLASKNLLPA